RYTTQEVRDQIRAFKHKGYCKQSLHRRKYIIQNFIPHLKNDWKVLIYADRYYVLFRGNRKNDFRASGSGLFKFVQAVPNGLLNFAKTIYDKCNIPNISLDIAFDVNVFHLIEFQALYFGTTTIVKSPFYFERRNGNFALIESKSELEMVYTESIIKYLDKQ
ncbi:MAG: hypothetical protein WAU11_13105, partial [Ignavibacteriaceae bacterium]